MVVSREAVKRAGVRSTKASAMLSGREVPDGHERSTAVQRFIDEQATEIPSGEWTASAIDVNDWAAAAPVAAGLCWGPQPGHRDLSNRGLPSKFRISWWCVEGSSMRYAPVLGLE